jgi:hypothetical protein
MGLLLNNELIWVSIPKNASFSIEHSLINSDLDIKRCNDFYKILNYWNLKGMDRVPHLHLKMKKLINEFGNKETFCIKRDFSERFISSIAFLWSKMEIANKHTPIINYNEITNDFLYNLFDVDTINNILCHSYEQPIRWHNVYSKFVNNKIDFHTTDFLTYESLCTLLPQLYWTDGEKCTYEFNTNNLDECKDFIKNKFNVEIEIPKLNSTLNIHETKIVNNAEFKNWLYANFEKRFDRTRMKII